MCELSVRSSEGLAAGDFTLNVDVVVRTKVIQIHRKKTGYFVTLCPEKFIFYSDSLAFFSNASGMISSLFFAANELRTRSELGDRSIFVRGVWVEK